MPRPKEGTALNRFVTRFVARRWVVLPLVLLAIACAILFALRLLTMQPAADAGTTAYEAARTLFLQGKYDDALAALSRVKADFPSTAPDAQRMIGCCYQWKGDYDRAVAEYRKLLTDYPASEAAKQAHFWIGTCYESKSLDGEAISEFLEQVKVAPEAKAAETRHKLATRYRVLGNAQMAEQHFRELRGLTSAADAATAKRANLLVGCYLRESGKWADAAEHYTKIKGKYPEEAEDITFQLAESQFASQQYTAAAQTYRDFAERFHNSPQAKHARLRVEESLRDLGRYDDALAYLKGLAEQGGDLEPDALLRQAEILGGYQNQSGAALDICQLLTEKFPQDTRIMGLVEFTRGSLYLNRLHDPAKAREHFQTMLTKYPDKNLSVQAACHIASCYYAERDFATARILFEKAATDYECPVKAWRAYARWMAGDCLFRQQKAQQAAAVWEEVAKEYPDTDWGKLAKDSLAGIPGR